MPAPDANGLVQANWPVTDTFTLPSTVPSGYYRVRFVLLDGRGTSTYVIVRSPPGHQSAILVQVPVNTWQAYNTWGGTSLYAIAGQAVQANRVSFDRPYYGNGLAWEYPLVLFLERQGYDVSYQTDVDTDRNPASLLGHRLVIVAGHGEYWTHATRDALAAARDAGVNLAFMGANAGYWQVRYENNDRIIVGYKSTADPITDQSLETILFRALNPPQPECALIGIQHQGGSLSWSSGDYSVVPSSLTDPWFSGTGFDASSVVRGVVGVETDTIPNNMTTEDSCGHQLTVFFQRAMGGDTLGNADATAYTAPSGAVVFAAGSNQFVWGLADGSSLSGVGGGLVDPRLQVFVENMLDDLSATRTAHLAVTLNSGQADPPPGGRVHVVAVVSNGGPDALRRATLEISLPTGVSFVRVASQGLRCSIMPLSCELDQLASGSSVDAVFTFRARLRRPEPITFEVVAPTASNPNPADALAQLVLEPHGATGASAATRRVG
jgi:hypothetical protein